MADDNLIELGADVHGIEDILRVGEAVGGLASRIKELLGVTTQYDKKGRVVGVTVRGLGDDFSTLTQKVVRTKKGWAIISEGAAAATSDLKKLKKAQEEAAAAFDRIKTGAVGNRTQERNESSAIAAKQLLKDSLQGSKIGLASPSELSKFDSAINSIVKQVKSGQISLSELDALFRKAAAGGTEFTNVEKQILDGYNRARLAATEFGDSAIRSNKDATIAAREAAKAQRDLAKAQQRDAAEATRAQQRAARETARAAQLAARDIARDQQRQAVETAKAQRRSVDAFASIRSGAADNKTSEREQASAIAARQILSNALQGPKAGVASTAELSKFNTAINSVVKQATDAKLTIHELDALFQKAASGGTEFTVVERQILDAYNRAKQAASEFGNASVNASNRAARAAQAQLKAQQAVIDKLIQAKQKGFESESKATQRGQSAQAVGVAQEAVSKTFSSQIGSGTPQQILNFNRAMQSALGLLQTNKVNLGQFLSMLSSVDAGKIQTGLTPALNALQGRLVAASNSFKNLGTDGEKAGQRILLSFQAVIRIFESQLLFAAFSKLRQGFSDSIQGAAEFSKQIALLQTISQDANLSFEQWATGIRTVSDQLGSPIAETAAAAYDALSNQVTKGADTFGFLSEAIEFARTTNSNAEDSVNLFSSALNSFNLSADQAGRVARTFFTTIDLGRVKSSELANSFGRSGTLANSLHISLEELQAGISVLTRQGIKANEAYTLLNNVMLKMIKPTDNLQARFKSWGVETGQAANDAFGFVGVLEKLSEAYQGNTAAAAEDFDEIRGARGIINLTGDALKDYKSDLGQIQNSGNKFDIAKQLVSQSEGQRLAVEFNKIKNFFVVDVGGKFLTHTVNLSDKFGGLAGVVRTVVDAIKILATTAAAFYLQQKINLVIGGMALLGKNILNVINLYRAGALASTIMASAATISMAQATFGVSILIGAVAGVVSAWNVTKDRSIAAIREIEARHQESANKIAQQENEIQDQRHQALSEGLDKSVQAFLQYTSKLRVEQEKLVDDIKDKQKEITEAFVNTFDALKGTLSKSATELENQAKKAADAIKDTEESITESIQDAQKALFERNLQRAKQNKDAAGEYRLVQQRVAQLRAEARHQLFDLNDLNAADKLFKEIQTVLGNLAGERDKRPVFGVLPAQQPRFDANGRQVRQRQNFKVGKVGEVQVDRFNRAPIEGQADRALKESIKLKGQFIAQQDVERKKAIATGDTQKAIVSKLEDDFKKLNKFSIFKKDGSVKSEFEGDKGRAEATRQLAELQQNVINGLNQAGASLPQRVLAISNFAGQLAKFREQLDQATGANNDQLAAQKKLEEIQAQEVAIGKEGAKVAASLQTLNVEMKVTASKSAEFVGNIKTSTELLKGALDGFNFVGSPEAVKLGQDLKGALANIDTDAAAKGPGFQERINANIEILRAGIARLNTIPGVNVFQKILKDADPNDPNSIPLRVIGALEGIKVKARELNDLQVRLGNAETEYAKASDILNALNNQLALIPGNASAAATGAETGGKKIADGINPIKQAGLDAASAVGSLIERINTLNKLNIKLPVAPGGAVEKKARGGLVGYFADGGFMSDFAAGKFAKGVDTIPVMAQRGEFMVNERETAKFLPLLRAINSGKLSAPSAAGGPSFNGDINITVQGGQTGTATAKSIGDSLRRELRRGTIRLN